MTRTAVVLTALPVEFTAVADRLAGAAWEVHAQGSRYLVGTSGGWKVAVAEIGRGNEEASYSTERALQHFSPDVALFAGVAGGVKDVSLGDRRVRRRRGADRRGRQGGRGRRDLPDLETLYIGNTIADDPTFLNGRLCGGAKVFRP